MMRVAGLLTAGLVLATAGCLGSGSKGTDTSVVGADGGGEDDECRYGHGDGKVSCAWGSGRFSFDLNGGDPAGYLFGIAEVQPDGEGWTGEDCGLGNPQAICHPMASSGMTLTIVDGTQGVAPGKTTQHHGDDDLAYYIYENATADCWWWGVEYAPFMHCTDARGSLCCVVR